MSVGLSSPAGSGPGAAAGSGPGAGASAAAGAGGVPAEASQNVRTSFDALKALGIVALDAPQDLVFTLIALLSIYSTVNLAVQYVLHSYH